MCLLRRCYRRGADKKMSSVTNILLSSMIRNQQRREKQAEMGFRKKIITKRKNCQELK